MDRKLALTIQLLAADKLSGSLKKIVGLGESGAQKLGRLKREARDLDRQMAAVGRELRGASGNVTGLITRERELATAIDGVNQRLERQKRLVQIDNRVGKMQAHADALKSAGTQNMIGGAGVLAPLIMAGREAMNFSSGMVDIQQKAELTNAEMVKMQGNILRAAQATHQLPEDMRSAVDVLASKGMDPRNAVNLIQPIGRLGTAFKVDLADGAAAAYANINNLKLPLAQTAKAFDVMAAGGNAGAFEIKDMARWFPNLTARMQALGQKGLPAVADLTAALQVAMNTAGSADEAANNISNLMAKINSPETIRKFHKNFAVDLPAAMKAAADKGKTPLEAIAEITQKATGGDMKKLGFVFEDQQAQMGLLALMQNLDQYRTMRADIAKSSGVVDRAFGQRELNDGMVAWNSFKVSLSTTAIVFGTKLLPVATQFLGILGPMVGAIGDFAQAHPQATTALLTLIATMGVAKIGLGALQFAFGSILGPAAQAWGAYQRFKTLGSVAEVFPRFAKAAGVARSAMIFLAQGVMRAGAMMLANPVVLVITAIVAAVALAAYGIYKYWGPISTFVQGVWAKVSGFITRHWVTIRNLFLGAMVIFTPLIAAIVLVASLIYRNWDRIKAATSALWGRITAAWDGIKSGVMSMVNAVAGIVGPFIAPFIQIQNYISGLVGRFFQFGINIVQGLINGIASMGGKVVSAIVNLVAGIGGKFAALLGIKSPSRVFMAYGGNITDGLAMGLERGERRPIVAVGKLATGVAGAMAVSSPAFAAGGTPAGAGAAPINITITVQQQAGEDGEALARRVATLIDQQLRSQRRSAYYD